MSYKHLQCNRKGDMRTTWGGGCHISQHILPCACDRSLAFSFPSSRSQSSTGTPAPPGPESEAFWGIRNRCASCPSFLNTKKHTLSCTHMLAAIQNRHQDAAGVTAQRDPELDLGQQHLRQERDAIGFSCDPPPPLSRPRPPSH